LPASGSPTVRRRELGALLRTLRTDRGWTVEYVAERLLVSPSKISRLETGQRGVSQRDIRDLCDLYEVDDALRDHLTDLAAEGKQQAWWQSRGLPYSTYVGLESEAALICDFGLSVIPGLLQAADYAREVLWATQPEFGADVIEQRVAGRLDRQRILTSANPPKFEAVIDESVIHRVPRRQGVMRAQLDKLLEASQLENVSIRILPFSAGLLPSGNNKFITLAFDRPEVPPVAFIESLTGDVYIEKQEDVQKYEKAFRIMLEASLSQPDSLDMIRSAAAGLPGSTQPSRG
jgi:transcriptional regulator with XRE-family HTH domain